MSGTVTDAVRARLERVGATAKAHDLYEGPGTDFYDRLVGSDRSEIREVLALARRCEGRILDLAAGGGRLTVPLVRSGRRVTAVDLSEDMLAHLGRALPDHPLLDIVVGDMRDFSLPQRYGLAIVGATSITLLDLDGRSRLYARVRRHLHDGGMFAFTVAGGASAAGFATSVEQEIRVTAPEGDERYLFAQQVDDDGAARVVNWVRVADISTGAEVTVFTSRLRILAVEALARELADAGFTQPEVTPVRTLRGQDILLLTTTPLGPTGTEDGDARS